MAAETRTNPISKKSAARKIRRRFGPNQQKVLLLLLGGLALSCARSPDTQWRILRGVREEWRELSKRAAEYAINKLYESKLVESRSNPDGSTTLVLSENGKKRALTYKSGTMRVTAPNSWDKKWRVVLFDIPESEREARDALRDHLEDMGFFILQRSVFVYPFDCKNEIDFLVELHDIRKYVRFMLADSIDNEIHLRKFFKLEP